MGGELTIQADTTTPCDATALKTFGSCLGLAFQTIDDILDATQSTEVLGKTARKEAAALTKKAMAALDVFGKKADHLHQIADFLVLRE